ncbi:MAG: peptidoglycan DD-metalloendopeptidase family protein [Candidatus Omnitrophota bacterium]|jgi:septal ring factor EnvC (AmiA/AmiB activator)|nr:peptidoglycan DD-metalloendopeptidase family protein [Candidatus Omnitrophota bacterium]MDD5518755.1 peptidoglycan DD-metalloendopeptidase family protein [Candidatus Omnitrophota bacterium]
MKKKLLIILFSLGVSGCATAPYVQPAAVKIPAGMTGTYHRIQKGQTLWKISRIYGVDLEELARINRITDATAIEIGRQLFIPNRFKVQPTSAGYSDNDDFIWPLAGRTIGSFGQMINNKVNKGINIQPYGSLEVAASRGGKVVFLSRDFAGLGKTVIIEHQDGLFTVYARNSEILVRAGDNVQKGSVIARTGSSGRDKNTYLHFEIRKGHISQNPLFYLP